MKAPPMQEYKLLIDGRWQGEGRALVVHNKYSGAEIGALPEARREDLDEALAAAHRASRSMADMPAHQRHDIQRKTAEL